MERIEGQKEIHTSLHEKPRFVSLGLDLTIDFCFKDICLFKAINTLL